MNSSAFIGLGYNFLQLTINSIEELEKQGNKNLLFFDGNLSEDESWLKYDLQTNWNDNNIAIPVLFNFYHGIELVLKGLILKCGGEIQKVHNLSLFLENLKKSPNPPNLELLNHFEQILSYDLNSFFSSNNKTADDFFELLKYPQLKKGEEVVFKDIRGLGTTGIQTFVEIKKLSKGVKENIKYWLKTSLKNEIQH